MVPGANRKPAVIMADIVDPEKRSRMMSAIRSKDTGPEMLVRRYLHACGLRYKLHLGRLPGKPDLVFPRYHTVLFVHGCFWHRHPGCSFAATPATRPEFWARKFAGNVARDQTNAAALKEMGWQVLTVWECETRDPLAVDQLFWQTVAGHPVSRVKSASKAFAHQPCLNPSSSHS